MRKLIYLTIATILATTCYSQQAPDVCNGHGAFNNGTCACYSSWSGAVCNMPICSNGGVPQLNACSCSNGFFGTFCENGPCYNNGVWNLDHCDCFSGYKGTYCNEIDIDKYTHGNPFPLLIIILVMVAVLFIFTISGVIAGAVYKIRKNLNG